MLGSYSNGNYRIAIMEDGTKVRYTAEDEYKPEFAESIDLTITKKCDGGCKFCYMGCTPEGKHSDIFKFAPFIESLKPYTEVAINGNDLSHPQLDALLSILKERNVIANMTVNAKHLIQHKAHLANLIMSGYIHGLGISPIGGTVLPDEVIQFASVYKNCVIHVINGIFDRSLFSKLEGKDIKLLILGYKQSGQGIDYRERNKDKIAFNMKWLQDHIVPVTSAFNVVTFDNLAIDQLELRDSKLDINWDLDYMGDEGEFTFYADLVDGYYAVTSFDEVMYPIESRNAIDCFQDIRRKVGKYAQ